MDGTFVGRRARTNEFGRYRMQELVGGMTLRASKKGYRSRSRPITLTACDSESSGCVGTHSVDFELRPRR